MMLRTLLPPLVIALAIVSAATLLVAATAIAPPPPLSEATASSQPRAMVANLTPFDVGNSELARVTAVELPATPAVVHLARLIYAPGSGGSRHAFPGPFLLHIETGVLTVALGGPGRLLRVDQATMAEGDFVLHAGESLALATATPASFENDGAVPTVALVAGVFPGGAQASRLGRRGPARWADDWSPGATVHPLVGGWVVDSPSDAAVVELRRLSLPPQATMALTAHGSTVLAVEAGTPTMAAERGLVWRQPPDGPNTSVAPPSAVTLLPDDGALLQEEAGVTLRNDGSGPLLLLVLTVEPEASVS